MTVTRVAIIGGSFNPPTISHALLGLEILRTCQDIIDDVWYLPSNHHPHAGLHDHKAERPDYETRLKWVKEMVSDIHAQSCDLLGRSGGVRICEIERDFDRPCYAKDVLEALSKRHLNHEFYWVIGSDCFEDLHKWAYIDWLADNVTFIVYPRPGFSSRRQGLLEINMMQDIETRVLEPGEVIVTNVSSSFVRQHPHATWALTPRVAKAWAEHQKG